MEEKAIQIDGKLWRYFDKGKSKKTLVILPNILLFPEEWLAYAKSVDSSYRILIPLYSPIDSYERMLNNLHEFFRKLKVEKFILLGNSLGGVFAQGYAEKYQKDVSHVILVATIAPNKLYGVCAWILRCIGVFMPTFFIHNFVYWSFKASLVQAENKRWIRSLKDHIFTNLSKNHFLNFGKCIITFCFSQRKIPQRIPVTFFLSHNDIVFPPFFQNLPSTYPHAASHYFSDGKHLIELNKQKKLLAEINKIL